MNEEVKSSDYINTLTRGSKGKSYRNDVIFNALECALDIRKFEINLYWKRAAYFWAFITAIFIAYFDSLDAEEPKLFLILGITLVGYIFSFAWYLVNRGSKYWQKNWELHVDFLEDKIMGSLYKMYNNPKNYRFINLLNGYPSSVSKINQLLSIIITLVWGVLFTDALSTIIKNVLAPLIIINIVPVVSLLIASKIAVVVLTAISILICWRTKGHIDSDMSQKPFVLRKN